MKSKISIIITNFRNLCDLTKCLDSLKKESLQSSELIVVDCLTNNIECYLKENYPNVIVIHFDKDIGVSAMHNIGVYKSSPNSDYIIFLDNDVIVQKGWLKKLVEFADGNSDVACVQPMIISIGESLDHSDKTAWETLFLSGCAFLTRRKVYQKVGGYDETYFISYDDIDYAWRCWLAGHRVMVLPQSIVIHQRGQTTGKASPRLYYFDTRNEIYTLIKNCNTKDFIWFLVVAMISKIIYGFLTSLKYKNTRFVIATVKGIVSGIHSFTKYELKRSKHVDSHSYKKALWIMHYPHSFFALVESIKRKIG